MWGCIEPKLIYGFGEGNENLVIDYNWIDEKYPYIGIYANELVRNLLNKAFYGIECGIEKKVTKIEKKW